MEIYVKNFKRFKQRCVQIEKLKPGSVLINSESPTMFRTALLFTTILACPVQRTATTRSRQQTERNRSMP